MLSLFKDIYDYCEENDEEGLHCLLILRIHSILLSVTLIQFNFGSNLLKWVKFFLYQGIIFR